MRKIFFAMLTLLSTIAALDAHAVPATNKCKDAMISSAGHYDYGDGSDDGVSVTYMWEEDPWYIILDSPGMNVLCTFRSENCPDVIAVDPHYVLNTAVCLGCEGGSSTTIAGAKCCLKYGKTTGPGGAVDC